MVLIPTKEMNDLRAVFNSYMRCEGCKSYIDENAPTEAKEAYKKWNSLWSEMWTNAEALM